MTKSLSNISMAVVIICSIFWTAGYALAQSAQDRAFDAVENNEIIDYGLIKNKTEDKYDGKIIDVILIENDEDMIIYKLKLLLNSGHIIVVLINAKTGEEMGGRGF